MELELLGHFLSQSVLGLTTTFGGPVGIEHCKQMWLKLAKCLALEKQPLGD